MARLRRMFTSVRSRLLPPLMLVAVASVVLVFAAGGGAATAGRGSQLLLAWGSGGDGELGNNSDLNSKLPVRVRLPKGTTATSMAGGDFHTVALTSTGQVLAWGYGGDGALGDGTTNSSFLPVKVKLPKGTKVTAVAAGADHSLALTSTGQVLAWGYNTDGQLGDGNSSGPSTCGGKPCSTKPVKVQLPKGTKVIRVAAGADHSLALTSTHEVLAWGNNFYGELGNGTSAGPTICFSGQACATTPIKVHFTKGTKVTAVAAGASHSLALTSAGEVLAWGENSDGELGDGTSAGPGACNADDPCSTEPVKVKVPKGSKVVAVGLGDRFSLALTSTGGVLAWGRNFYGQLGDGTFTGPQKCFFGQACSKTPVKVRLPQAAKVVALAAGATHALALTSTGGVLAWGDNFYGELGVGTFTGPHKCDGGEPCSTKPLKVKLPTGDKANAVRAGSFAYHSLALVHHT